MFLFSFSKTYLSTRATTSKDMLHNNFHCSATIVVDLTMKIQAIMTTMISLPYVRRVR